jgi:hypothetical protein
MDLLHVRSDIRGLDALKRLNEFVVERRDQLALGKDRVNPFQLCQTEGGGQATHLGLQGWHCAQQHRSGTAGKVRRLKDLGDGVHLIAGDVGVGQAIHDSVMRQVPSLPRRDPWRA